ncbi:heparanase-like [Frieseomelitta varia]|uniref:heparanase-like n=1 Tax=Frieseomelitta varia TaxID=561572 RepID=UPI001CB6978A|nr:heparanase-like [Frieseomelitta varia]XP_043517825.1 heparanase-like [Frieseomelitta varia]
MYFITNDRDKNEYKKLGKLRIQTTLHPAFTLIFLGFCMIFLILSAWNFNNTLNRTITSHVFYLNSRQPLVHTVSDKFLSFGLDTSLLRDMKSLPIKDNKFINLARHLAPAYVRIGGTSADCLHFNQTTQIISEEVISLVDGQDISNFTINGMDFENLYKFATESKLRMIFDLNVLIRADNGSWDDINVKNIISFAKNKNMKLDWQLGNEPNSFHHVFNRNVSAIQLAHDYHQLRQLLNEVGYNESLLVGPEVNHVGDIDHKGEYYAKTFLENDKNSVNYVTWHQYYLNGREAQLTDFINISTFNYLPKQIKSMQEAIKSSGELIPMWLSETSTAYGGGAPELSDRFVAGFLWLDKLGYSAIAGLNVVTRQSLFGGNYAMIGPDLIPNPDWWVSVIFKKFVSEKVLRLSTSLEYLRFYAHCTPKKAWIGKVSAITIYGSNLANFSVPISIQGIPIFHRNAKAFLYVLTSDSLQSRTIKVNGEILKLQSNGNLPSFQPIVFEPTQQITLPSYSMVFIVIHGAKVPICYI